MYIKGSNVASVPSDILNKAMEAGKGFKWHNKEANKNWEYARQGGGKRNIMSQSIDINMIQALNTGNLSVVLPDREQNL